MGNSSSGYECLLVNGEKDGNNGEITGLATIE